MASRRWKFLLGIVAVAVLLIFLTFLRATKSDRKPTATLSATTATTATTTPAKPPSAKPSAKPAKPATTDKKTKASEATTVASSTNLVSEFQKLRDEIEGLKNHLSTPTINFPPEIVVRLMPGEIANLQTQPKPHRRLSDKEVADKFWREHISQPEP